MGDDIKRRARIFMLIFLPQNWTIGEDHSVGNIIEWANAPLQLYGIQELTIRKLNKNLHASIAMIQLSIFNFTIHYAHMHICMITNTLRLPKGTLNHV